MTETEILHGIGQGRTDLVFELLGLPDRRAAPFEGEAQALQWFVYYNDVTTLKAVLEAGETVWSVSSSASTCPRA